MSLVIVYHGTNARAAKAIKQGGFKAGTYFALHLENALGFGGLHVFEVAVEWKKWMTDAWQFTTDEWIFSDQIVKYAVYRKPLIALENDSLRERVFLSNSSCDESPR